MRYFNNGSFFTVTVSRNEVQDFKDKWPCSGLPCRAISFQFDKRNGDLVDMTPNEIDGEAALALSQDAQAYGDKKRNVRKP